MLILFLAANPSSTGALDLEAEFRAIRDELERSKFSSDISIEYPHALRPNELIEAVRNLKPHIVHFSGIGTSSGITFQGEGDNEAVNVSGRALETFFEGRGVKCVLLNGCYNATQAVHIQKSVGAVIGTSNQLDENHARFFSAAFYSALGDGLSIAEAVRDGTSAMVLNGGEAHYETIGDLGQVLLDFGADEKPDVDKEAPANEGQSKPSGKQGSVYRGARFLVIATLVAVALLLIWSMVYPGEVPDGVVTLFVIVSMGIAIVVEWFVKRKRSQQ